MATFDQDGVLQISLEDGEMLSKLWLRALKEKHEWVFDDHTNATCTFKGFSDDPDATVTLTIAAWGSMWAEVRFAL